MSPTETTRRHAIALSECPGWVEWVHPFLQQTLARQEQSLLDSTSLTESELAKLRIEYQSLKGVLKGLERQVRDAFAALSDEAKAVVPESARDKVYQAFAHTLRGVHIPASGSGSLDTPPLTFPPAPTFNPFAGTPSPATPSKKTEKAAPAKKSRRKNRKRSA